MLVTAELKILDGESALKARISASVSHSLVFERSINIARYESLRRRKELTRPRRNKTLAI
jgi:hypothetical protein